MTDWLMDGLLRWLAEQVIDLLGGLLNLLTSSIFLSPDVTVWPQVEAIAGRSALVVNACFVLAIIAAGVAVMVGDSVQTRYGVKELVPRLVAGFALSTFSVPLTGALIGIANALTVSMTGSAAPTTQAVTFVADRLKSALTDGTNSVLAVVIGLLVVALMVMLSISWLMRIGVLIILAAVAPIALACYATPWTQSAADLWWRTLLGCLVTPTLQAVAFSTGLGLLVDPAPNMPIAGADNGAETKNLLCIVVVLWTTVKIPALMSRLVTQTHHGPNVMGLILRTVTLQGLTRGLTRRTTVPPGNVDASTHTHHHYRATSTSTEVTYDRPR